MFGVVGLAVLVVNVLSHDVEIVGSDKKKRHAISLMFLAGRPLFSSQFLTASKKSFFF